MSITRFAEAYPPDKPRRDVTEDIHDEVGGAVPRSLHDLWDHIGFGKHRNGLLDLIDPTQYYDHYAGFFGGGPAGRIPFLMNAFGEPIAYRRISAREGEVSILHTYGPKIEVLAYDFDDFFDRVLLTDDGLREVVNVSLFNQVKSGLRSLRQNEVYGFDPQLLEEMPKGTKADATFFGIVDAREHLNLLLNSAKS